MFKVKLGNKNPDDQMTWVEFLNVLMSDQPITGLVKAQKDIGFEMNENELEAYISDDEHWLVTQLINHLLKDDE